MVSRCHCERSRGQGVKFFLSFTVPIKFSSAFSTKVRPIQLCHSAEETVGVTERYNLSKCFDFLFNSVAFLLLVLYHCSEHLLLKLKKVHPVDTNSF